MGPNASTPGPAHSRAGLSKHSHTASTQAGLGVAEPPFPMALGIYLAWAETTQSAVITFPQPQVLQVGLWDISYGLTLCPQVREFLHTPVLYNSGKQTKACARFWLMWLQPLITINIHKALCRKDNIFPEFWTKLLVIYYILAYNNGIPLCILTEYIIPH